MILVHCRLDSWGTERAVAADLRVARQRWSARAGRAGTDRRTCPAEETLCPVVAHDWVNDEYKHLVVKASPKALAAKPGQFFNLLCPSPDAGELWLRRPQSVYRVDRGRAAGSSFSTNASAAARAASRPSKPGDTLNMVGPLGVGFTLEPGWKNIVVLGRGVGLATMAPISQLAGEQRRARDRDPERAQPELVMAADLFERSAT